MNTEEAQPGHRGVVPILFASQIFDPETAGGEERRVRPLMPLRRGHLAVLIAAGFLNNILLEAGGRRV